MPETISTDIDLDHLDLTDVELFAAGPPHEAFALMRAKAPVHWNANRDIGFWSVTRYDDIGIVNHDFETYSSERGGVNIQEDTILPFEMARMAMINRDPPDHTKLRKIVQKVFTARAVAEREGHIRTLVNRLIDEVTESGSCDLVADIAVPMPLAVIAEMLGVPRADQPKLFDWTNRAASDDPTQRQDPEDAVKAMGEIGQYLFSLVADRRANPQDDLLSRLIEAEVDGERLDDLELTINFFLLMGAGNETTRNTFAGGMLTLIEHPEERAKLLADPGLITGAVEEILRWQSVVMHQRRTATRDTVLHDVPIKEGDKVVMWLVSGNRDERAFKDPDRFDVTREGARHQAFGGGGRHFCLGNQLARLELRVLFEEVLRRIPDMEVAGPVQRTRTNLFNGLIEMPVAFSPGTAETARP